MSARLVTKCDVCGNPNLRMVLSLGSSPPTCNMEKIGERQPSSTHYPLDLMYCEECTLAQLSVAVDPEIVFPLDYPYSSGHSLMLHANFEELARQAEEYLGPGDLVVDIGANDGTLLSKMPDYVWAVGVEPTGQARNISGPYYQRPFNAHTVDAIINAYGHAKVITACNVLAHVEDLDGVMEGIHRLLTPDGVLIAENHDLASVMAGQWDTIYHEHLRFFSPHSFEWLLRNYGLGRENWKRIPTHGGSFRMTASRSSLDRYTSPGTYDFDGLARDARARRNDIRSALLGGGMYAIGATARATTLINYCGLDVEDIACVCEVSDSDKIGRLIPGTRIPVVDEARLFEDQPEDMLLLSWHLADVIVPKLRERGYEGEIIVPLPALEYA